MATIATILHISDLHLTEALTETGRQHWIKNFGVKSHAFGRLYALATKINELRAIGQGPDVVVATGDISTDGSEGALRTALEFIENEEIYRGTPGRLATFGLAFPKEKRIVLPGNHDRYGGSWLPLQKSSDLLEKIFQTPEQYPYVVGFRRSEANSEKMLLFFVFDSTASQLASFSSNYTPWYRIARGRIEDGECDKLLKMREDIVKTGEVAGLDGNMMKVNYENAIKVVLLHHHPVEVPGTKPNDKLTLMENNKKFVSECYKAGIDLVLFGHQHVGSRQLLSDQGTSEHQIEFFCCPTTSEYSAERGGFYLLRFDEDQFVTSQYVWNGKSFYEDQPITTPYQRTRSAKA